MSETICQHPARIGIEVPELYDGVLFWRCPDCHVAWHRFPEGHDLRRRAEPFITPDATTRRTE